jgi:prepilin-type N-terminal cleavage/methylation domain-containing protein
MRTFAGTRSRGAERGFTLVEILVVITIIAALISIVAAVIPRATQANRRAQCANNLRQIGGMLVERQTDKGLGSRGGSAMLLQTYTLGMIKRGDERVFICPGDRIIRGQNLDDPEFKKRYENIDLNRVDPLIISYAGINRKLHPLRPDSKEKQAWGADCQGEDHRSGHHQSGLNVLFEDASVLFLDSEALELGPEDPIVIGVESSQKLLQKFTVHE